MTQTWTLIVGILTGSAGATVLGKFFDIFQKGREHRMELRKTFFAAQLKAAEDIATHLTAALTMMNYLKLLYKMVQEDLGRGPVHEVRRFLQDHLAKSAVEAMPLVESLKAAAAYNLYFGFETNRDFLEKAAPIHSFLSELGPVLDAVMKFDFTAYANQAVASLEYDRVVGVAKERVGEFIGIIGAAADTIATRLEYLHSYFADREYLR